MPLLGIFLILRLLWLIKPWSFSEVCITLKHWISLFHMTNLSSSLPISSLWIYSSFCLANCYGGERRCPTAGSEGPSCLTGNLCRLAVWQLFICSLTQSSSGKPPQWHQGWHGVPEPHHTTGLTLVLLQHLSTSLSVEKINHLPGMSIKKKKTHKKAPTSIIKLKILSAHIRNIHPNGLFILLLNSIYNNIAIAQEQEHVHVQKANKLSKLLITTNKPNVFPQNNMLSTIIKKKDTCVKMKIPV